MCFCVVFKFLKQARTENIDLPTGIDGCLDGNKGIITQGLN